MGFDFLLPYLNSNIAGVFAILLSFFLVLSWSGKSLKDRKPPEAAGGWPLIGHLHVLAGSKLPYLALGELADKYGPIFSIRIGLHPAVVVTSSELAKEIFTKYDVVVSSRPKLTVGKLLGHNYANFGFCPYGAYWREMRKITASELMSNRRLELLKHIRASEVESSVKELYELWAKKKVESTPVLVEMKQWVGNLNLNVILRMIAGKRFFGRRLCPGISFGLQMTQLVLATFLHGFHILTPANGTVDMTGSPGLTNIKATPLEILLKPRLSPSLY
ncbi:hypothetical protein GOBAR_DD32033 [Gossypium barbadense]|nr:hypothetical protein GOBAR_DD32033 [Gossypium barbadense]